MSPGHIFLWTHYPTTPVHGTTWSTRAPNIISPRAGARILTSHKAKSPWLIKFVQTKANSGGARRAKIAREILECPALQVVALLASVFEYHQFVRSVLNLLSALTT